MGRKCFSLAAVVLIFSCAVVANSQTQTTPITSCITKDDVNQLLAKLNSDQTVSFNKKLTEELVKLEGQRQDFFNEAVDSDNKEKSLKRMTEFNQKAEQRLCGVLKEFGWPTKKLVGEDGVDAAMFLLKSAAGLRLQVDLFPVVVAAVKKGEISKAGFADYFDRVRVRGGLRQIFGTQASLVNGILVLAPIEEEVHVDDRRKQYGLPPLADYLRYLEESYRLPLVKSPATSMGTREELPGSTEGELSTEAAGIRDVAGEEVVRVNTQLVNLNVSVFSNTQNTYVGTLPKEDFQVLEDGQPQAVTFFEATNEPFDLVLLIDLSGSTSKKRDLIRLSTQRFIEAARPTDRVAIVTFADTVDVVSPLTNDRAKLLASIGNMKSSGWSNIWDAIKFTMDNVVGPKSQSRRRAIVLMTDGADNALEFLGRGSKISFADLVESVRRNDTLIIPIFLETTDDRFAQRLAKTCQATLSLLATETGGPLYRAKKIEDLKGVYEQVINDLGKVYSLGYRPGNSVADGSWRAVKVQLLNHPEMVTRARPGYYAH
jgi:Ca-activated chloride channel family protein